MHTQRDTHRERGEGGGTGGREGGAEASNTCPHCSSGDVQPSDSRCGRNIRCRPCAHTHSQSVSQSACAKVGRGREAGKKGGGVAGGGGERDLHAETRPKHGWRSPSSHQRRKSAHWPPLCLSLFDTESVSPRQRDRGRQIYRGRERLIPFCSCASSVCAEASNCSGAKPPSAFGARSMTLIPTQHMHMFRNRDS